MTKPISPGRRSLLKAAGAVAGLAALSACSGSTRTSSPATADWNALAKDLAGPLVQPGSAGYDTDRRLFDPRSDGLRPSLPVAARRSACPG